MVYGNLPNSRNEHPERVPYVNKKKRRKTPS